MLDRERLCLSADVCSAQLDVTTTPVRHLRLIRVTVFIDDVNDNAPTFPVSSVTVSVNELAPPGSRFPLPVATDADSGRYQVHEYILQGKSRYFRLETSSIDPSTDLFLVLSSAPDREEAVEHHLRVSACDGGQPRLSAVLDVVVVIADANDHAPVFERSVYNAKITENCAVGKTLMRLFADDQDEGDNGRVVYSLLKTTPVIFYYSYLKSSSSSSLSLSPQKPSLQSLRSLPVHTVWAKMFRATCYYILDNGAHRL